VPKEPPRHELKPATIRKEVLGRVIEVEVPGFAHEGTYKEAERSAKDREQSLGRDIRNPERRQARSATHVVDEALQSLNAANNGLAKLYAGPNEGFFDTRGGKDLKTEARANGTDLAGYFNDYKLALEAGRPRSKSPSSEQIHLDRLLDWLELAEQKGGISGWLAQWNAMMRDPFQRTDISRMADVAESIRAGIEFQKAMIRELDLLDKEGIEGPPQAEDVISLLNSIAYEISRQLGEALAKRFEAGSKLTGARNSLKRSSDHESRIETVRKAIDNLSVRESLSEWSSSRARTNMSPIIDPVISDLEQWEEAATQMSALTQTIGTPEYPGPTMEMSIAKRLNEQAKVVDHIGKAAEAIFNMNMTLPGSDGISIFGKEQLLFTLGQIASGILEKHRSFATQLKNQKAKDGLILLASQMATVYATIEKKRQDPHLPRFYDQALTAAKGRTLRDFWSTNRDHILNQVKERGGADPAGKTALADLDALFKDNLGGKLDDWLKRENNPEDIYGLAWQLVATLREYKTSATGILDEWRQSFAVGDKNRGVAQFCRESMDQLLDSIIGAVAQGLDDDIAAGRG
jgi:hypothetical protein